MVIKLEKLKSQLHAAKQAYKLESEEKRRLDEELENQREGYEESIACLQMERDELKRKNDDLAIANADYEMQLKQLREAGIEAHKEITQLSQQLTTANSKVDLLRRIQERHERYMAKAINACHQHLLVSLDLPTTKPDCEVCETSRFIYYLLDVLDGPKGTV